MSVEVHFCFHGSLNDFLIPAKRFKSFSYPFRAHQTVMDAIESLGPPHAEVGKIVCNQGEMHPTQKLQDGDRVEVFGRNPEDSRQMAANLGYRFVVDVQLGKLAKYLRTLGFDTSYSASCSKSAILEAGISGKRIVLTRDAGLLKYREVEHGYWVRSRTIGEQLKEVMIYWGLKAGVNPFTRCLDCNGTLQEIGKNQILESLQAKTIAYFREFYQCQHCLKIYWKGSHYERMLQKVQKLVDDLQN